LGQSVGGNVNGLGARKRPGDGARCWQLANWPSTDFYGPEPNQWGGGYSGRFGPTTLTAGICRWWTVISKLRRRPISAAIGRKDYRLTTRVARARILAADGPDRISPTIGAGAVGEFVLWAASLFEPSALV